MSERLPVVSADAVIRALESNGFIVVSQRGSHIKLKNAQTGRVAIVPNYSEIASGTLHSILLQAALSRERFIASLRR